MAGKVRMSGSNNFLNKCVFNTYYPPSQDPLKWSDKKLEMFKQCTNVFYVQLEKKGLFVFIEQLTSSSSPEENKH